MSPSTKDGALTAGRAFFRDLQEWEWIPRRFAPGRALETPRPIRALLGPNPRVIADEVWAKLLWAGINLTAEDLPSTTSGPRYPFELSRAVALTWLFSGQRSDEIRRLRTGCVRWQHDGTAVSPDADVLARDAVCLLDVPTHKTGTSFTKPVDPLLGQAIEVWQAVRPEQPMMLDAKTGERVKFLFAHRAKRISKDYINRTIIPALCTLRRLKPASFNNAAITSRFTARPWAASSVARRRSDFVVQVNGPIGSPCVLSSTNASSAARSPGSFAASAGRPAPRRRTRPSGSAPSSNSTRPRLTHPVETPAALATAAIPPCPSCRASAAYSRRHCRSSRCGVTASNFARNGHGSCSS
jgi:hypothetical protein